MVYSSAPLYLDPHNWHHHQQQAQQQLGVVVAHGGGGENNNNNPQPHHQQSASVIHMAPPPPPPAPCQAVGGGGSSSSIRPGSMADRARQAKIPQPEPGLKCPRCESTNTKFCYFNNYSLTQPRHFCKMCRRYWTRGGALRNVPVGGGCRRNKRSSKSSTGGGASKSVGGERRPGNNNNSTSPISSHSNNTELNNSNNNLNSHGNMLDTSLPSQSFVPRLTHFPLMASLQGLNNHSHYGSASSNLGLNFGGMMSSASQGELGFQIGGNSDQWRSHLFPNFLSGFEPPPHQPSSGLYQFPIDHQSIDQAVCHPPPSRSSLISSINQQLFRPSMTTSNNSSSTEQKRNNEAAAIKAEGVASGQQGGLNLQAKSFLGMSENSQYNWVGNSNNNNNNSTWTTDLSGLNNSSTTSLL